MVIGRLIWFRGTTDGLLLAGARLAETAARVKNTVSLASTASVLLCLACCEAVAIGRGYLLRFSHSDYKPRSKTKMSATGKREWRLQHEEEM